MASDGSYAIENVPPGHYNLGIMGPGAIVTVVSDLPPAGNISPTDQSDIKKIIDGLSHALSSGRAEDCPPWMAPGCELGLGHAGHFTPAEFIGNFGEDLAQCGKRDIILLRVFGDRATAYTHSVAKSIGRYTNADIYESWKLARDKSRWLVTSYWNEADLNLLMVSTQAAYRLPDSAGKRDFPGSGVLTITDDPALTNIEVKPGATSAGHNWTLTIPAWARERAAQLEMHRSQNNKPYHKPLPVPKP